MKKKEPRKPNLEAKIAQLEKRLEESNRIIEAHMEYHRNNPVPHMISVPKEPETFEDCCHEVARKNPAYDAYFKSRSVGSSIPVTTIPSEKRAKQLAAIAKMMTVADALNPEGVNLTLAYPTNRYLKEVSFWDAINNPVRFDVRHIEKAIKILGEETIKTAFGL